MAANEKKISGKIHDMHEAHFADRGLGRFEGS